MKQITSYILEGIKINKNIKINKDNINIDVNFNGTEFNEDEVNIIKDFSQNLKVPVTAIASKKFSKGLISYINSIYVYFNDNWNTHKQNIYLEFNKDKYNNTWKAIIYNDKNDSFFTKNNKIVEGNIDYICSELIDYLNEDKTFYNDVKNYEANK